MKYATFDGFSRPSVYVMAFFAASESELGRPRSLSLAAKHAVRLARKD
jgi:hypothetical protein